MQALKDDHELSGYDGEVLYFEAEDLSLQTKTINIDVQELAQKKQENLNSWRALAPHMNIYPVEADHMTMLDERFCDYYFERINNIVLPQIPDWYEKEFMSYFHSEHDVDALYGLSTGKTGLTPSLRWNC